MSDQVAVRLRRAGLVGRTVVLELRYRRLHHHHTLEAARRSTPISGRRIYDEVSDVVRGVERRNARIRLVGVRMEHLSPASDAVLGLWDTDDGWRDAEDAIDAVADRFGRQFVQPRRLSKPPSNPT